MAHLTQKAIKDSFIKLLNKHPFDKITVKDIVQDCGINRNTFYYYYQDIYDLLEDVFESETVEMLEETKEYQTWQEGIIESAKFAMENKQLIYHVYNSINRDQLERYLYNVSEHIMGQYVMLQLGESGLDVDEYDLKLITVFYKHAVVGIIMEWVQNGMKDEPEAVIKRLGELVDGNIRQALERAAK